MVTLSSLTLLMVLRAIPQLVTAHMPRRRERSYVWRGLGPGGRQQIPIVLRGHVEATHAVTYSVVRHLGLRNYSVFSLATKFPLRATSIGTRALCSISLDTKMRATLCVQQNPAKPFACLPYAASGLECDCGMLLQNHGSWMYT